MYSDPSEKEGASNRVGTTGAGEEGLSQKKIVEYPVLISVGVIISFQLL